MGDIDILEVGVDTIRDGLEHNSRTVEKKIP